jgi:NCS1 family nucleobase:cation symporter-1
LLQAGTNWRAALTTLVIVTPLLPGLAYSISPSKVSVNTGINHLFSISWLYGFHASIALYYVLTLLWPMKKTFVSETISGSTESLNGVEVEDRIDIGIPEEKVFKSAT